MNESTQIRLPGEFLANGGILRRGWAKVYPENGIFQLILSTTEVKREISAKKPIKPDDETD
ncbi:hypothetical protein EGT71_07765 [Atlantibacter subterranea]|uniref:Uncharacterized protein n=1 Tax=Atlantibacter subterraneus TaxID=255519 RepID=A0A3R9GBT3_9ENTR|nr:hypothetical protein EGK67_08815 [Atlantibacter subterranea]RSE05899.1 hypothetical protein EGT84_10335 [Atlantibacter subterranea]RSE27204.1 hypothetical protein EGT71_07765 [Atlantibacter subterranea]